MDPVEPIIETERVYRTMEEIYRRYPNEWVVIVDCDAPGMVMQGGVVHAHCPNRKALSPIIRSLWDCGIYWTGKKRHPYHHVEILDDSINDQAVN